MASLTDWEKDHLENVHLLLEQAKQSYLYFEEKELGSTKKRTASPSVTGSSSEVSCSTCTVFSTTSTTYSIATSPTKENRICLEKAFISASPPGLTV